MSDTVKVLRGSVIIPGGQTTLTLNNGVDYTLEDTDDTKWYFRITNSNFTGMGKTSSGGNQNVDDFTVVPVQSGANTVLTRVGSVNDCRVDWEIVQYTGTTSDNEFIVREKGLLTLVSGVATSSPALPSGISNNNDVVIWITGQASNSGNRNSPHSALFTAEMGSTTWTATRGNSSANGYLAYAIVEYTGSDYTVNSESFTVASAVTTHTLSTAVSDVTKTFIHAQNRYDTSLTAGLDDSSVRVYLSSTTALSVRNETATDLTLKEHVVYIVENPNLTVQRVVAEMAGTGEEETEMVSITQVADTELTSLTGLTSTSTGGGTALPRGYINFTLSSDSSVLLKQSDNGQTSRYSFEVVEWPTGSVKQTLTMESGSFSMTGQSPVINHNRVLSVGAGSITLNGPSININYGRVISPIAGSLSFTASDSQINYKRSISINAGSLSYSGQPVELVYNLIRGPTYTITLQAGTLSASGSVAGLNQNRSLIALSGYISLSGQGIQANLNRTINISSGSVSLNGETVATNYNRPISLGGGALSLAAQPFTLDWSGFVAMRVDGYSCQFSTPLIAPTYLQPLITPTYSQPSITPTYKH